MAETIKSKKIFLEGLLNWFKTNKRKFSWRTKKDPYKILIAEKMLQKTSTRNVEKVYDKFIEKYPEPRLLAEASIEDIKEIIKPLGLQTKRARELRSTAVITTRDSICLYICSLGGTIPCLRETSATDAADALQNNEAATGLSV